MGLSAEKKRSLSELYETWGIEKVRRDLERHYHPSLLSSEVSAFARAWVNAKETRERRREQYFKAFKILFYSLLAGVAAALFVI